MIVKPIWHNLSYILVCLEMGNRHNITVITCRNFHRGNADTHGIFFCWLIFRQTHISHIFGIQPEMEDIFSSPLFRPAKGWNAKTGRRFFVFPRKKSGRFEEKNRCKNPLILPSWYWWAKSHDHPLLVGGWAYPSEKWWSSSVGKSCHPAMFQTTNQIIYRVSGGLSMWKSHQKGGSTCFNRLVVQDFIHPQCSGSPRDLPWRFWR